MAGGRFGCCGCGATEGAERQVVGAECVVDGAVVAFGAAVAAGASPGTCPPGSVPGTVVSGMLVSGVFPPVGPPAGGIGGFGSGVETFGCDGGACDSEAGVVVTTDVEVVGPV